MSLLVSMTIRLRLRLRLRLRDWENPILKSGGGGGLLFLRSGAFASLFSPFFSLSALSAEAFSSFRGSYFHFLVPKMLVPEMGTGHVRSLGRIFENFYVDGVTLFWNSFNACYFFSYFHIFMGLFTPTLSHYSILQWGSDWSSRWCHHSPRPISDIYCTMTQLSMLSKLIQRKKASATNYRQ